MGLTPFLGEVMLFAGDFAPRNWSFCNGQLISIQSNTALFSILGTSYGGNGTTNFALPDLRGRVPLSPGQAPGLTPRDIGESGGEEGVVLNQTQMPAHAHQISGSAAPYDTNRVNGASPADGGFYASPTSGTNMSGAALSTAGSSQPHENHQPFLVVNYVICVVGIFPARN